MNIIYKYIFFIMLLGSFVVCTFQTGTQKNQKSIYECIHENKNRLHLTLQTTQDTEFNVFFVERSKPSCINPYFPAIHITTEAPHNAWLHIVYTDAADHNLRMFIDAADKTIPSSPYPFYSCETDFLDAPLWQYSFFHKPLSFWKGHAFAIEINHNTRTIKNLGGIEWGFKLHFMGLRPCAIRPRLVDKNAWNQAWELIKNHLPDYKNI